MSQSTTHRQQTPSNLLPFPALSAAAETAHRLAHPAQAAPQETTSGPSLAVAPAHRVTPTAALAHDTRNALASLELLSGMLAEPGVLSAAHAALADDLQQAAVRLGALVTELATDSFPFRDPSAATDHYGRKGDGSNQPVGQVLAGCRRILQLTAGPRIAVYVSSESRLPAVTLPDANLERVLVNLVKNAAEAMPDGGTVRITARRALSRTSPAILVQVVDDGPGIPAHALEHIFKAGFSSKRGGRTWSVECGLGLTIVRQLVEAAGGSIRAASTPRRGATLEVRLPCSG